ncbi:hypothetical protein WICPIJ_000599 [Wickerhamomyces pijperi]|uniref:Uncharacterized protein n=1 Tax=Wickerhamomyces pijperi TaxID=599730 RepID=A0A9P8TRS6_WICPI|nr:hypothetical protein WICPIJ_000599 [Wickerhamomyces pijperi]
MTTGIGVASVNLTISLACSKVAAIGFSMMIGLPALTALVMVSKLYSTGNKASTRSTSSLANNSSKESKTWALSMEAKVANSSALALVRLKAALAWNLVGWD